MIGGLLVAKAKQQNYLHGAAIMTAGVIIMKILGALYKIPLGQYARRRRIRSVPSGLLCLQPVSDACDGGLSGGAFAHDKRGADSRTSDAGAPYISRGMVDILCPRRGLLDGNVRVPRLACRHSYKQSRCRFQHPGSRTGGAPGAASPQPTED